ncbi:hypothetical protein ACWGNE_07230 [Streptomyces xiamenensis]
MAGGMIGDFYEVLDERFRTGQCVSGAVRRVAEGFGGPRRNRLSITAHHVAVTPR